MLYFKVVFMSKIIAEVHSCYNLIMRLLGIDYGTKNVGIAVGESAHKMAFPKIVLKNDKMLIMTLKKLCLKENIEKLANTNADEIIANEILKTLNG